MSKRATMTGWLTAACLATAMPAVADEASDLNNAVKPTTVAARVGAGSLDSPISLPGGFEFSADEGESDVTYKASFKLFGNSGHLGVTDFVSITAKAPLEKADAKTALSSLKGLGNATSVELKYSHIQLTGDRIGEPEDLAEESRICRAVLRAYLAKHGAPPAAGKPPTCSDENGVGDNDLDNVLVRTYAPEEYGKYRALYFEPGAALTMWGLTGAAGEQKFDYRDPATLAEQSVRKTPWSAGAYFAWEPLSWRTLFIVRGEHKRLYSDVEKTIRCSNPADTSTCVEAPFGAPTKENQDVVSLEIRRRLSSVGFALTARYDVGEDDVAIEVPVYFIQDNDGNGFNGGVKATWDSKTKDARIGVFMNKSFSFFEGL